MPHYKDTNNKLHFLDNSEDAEKYLPVGYVSITAIEAESIRITSLPPPDYATEKSAVMAEFKYKRDFVIGRLSGISYAAFRASDAATVTAIDVAIQGLKDIPENVSVTAAIGGAATRSAISTLYYGIAAQLQISSSYAYTAFNGMDM